MKDTAALVAKQATVAGITTTTSRATYASSGMTMIAGLNVEAWGVIAGIVVALVTLGANIYFQRQKHKIDVMLAQAQLEKTATAAVDKAQKEILEKMLDNFKEEFGENNKRKGGDRRIYNDPNYRGSEKRVRQRRQSISGDTEDAKTLRELVLAAQEAARKLETLKKKQEGE